MDSTITLRAGGLAVALALLAAACGSAAGRVPAPAAGGDAGGRGGAATLLPASPTALPEFDLPRFRELLGQLRGIPVVVNVWASWCGPCEREAPGLAAVSTEFEGRAQFVGVDIQDFREPAREFITRHGWTYPSVFDPDAEIRNGLGFVGQPVTVIYDRSGNEAFVWSGEVTEDQLREELAAVVDA